MTYKEKCKLHKKLYLNPKSSCYDPFRPYPLKKSEIKKQQNFDESMQIMRCEYGGNSYDED